jgi:hypothetical protein
LFAGFLRRSGFGSGLGGRFGSDGLGQKRRDRGSRRRLSGRENVLHSQAESYKSAMFPHLDPLASIV